MAALGVGTQYQSQLPRGDIYHEAHEAHEGRPSPLHDLHALHGDIPCCGQRIVGMVDAFEQRRYCNQHLTQTEPIDK